MLDVHAPHESVHTWRDFFIHIATIVVGLIIAVGLEQSVEALHHHRERTELRQSLLADARKAVKDTTAANLYTVQVGHWLDHRIDQVQDALTTNHPLLPADPMPFTSFTVPDDPAWKAAKNSGIVELLPQEEIKIYSDINADELSAEGYHLAMNEDSRRLVQFTYKFTRSNSAQPDFTHAERADLKEYLNLLAASKTSMVAYSFTCKELHGAENAILHGKTTLADVQSAETDPW
jgi:hypothetical protein